MRDGERFLPGRQRFGVVLGWSSCLAIVMASTASAQQSSQDIIDNADIGFNFFTVGDTDFPIDNADQSAGMLFARIAGDGSDMLDFAYMNLNPTNNADPTYNANASGFFFEFDLEDLMMQLSVNDNTDPTFFESSGFGYGNTVPDFDPNFFLANQANGNPSGNPGISILVGETDTFRVAGFDGLNSSDLPGLFNCEGETEGDNCRVGVRLQSVGLDSTGGSAAMAVPQLAWIIHEADGLRAPRSRRDDGNGGA